MKEKILEKIFGKFFICASLIYKLKSIFVSSELFTLKKNVTTLSNSLIIIFIFSSVISIELIKFIKSIFICFSDVIM